MRYFNYYDDTLSRLYRHDSGYLVNRKPTVFSFMGQRPKKHNGKKIAVDRMAKRFLTKLKEMGL